MQVSSNEPHDKLDDTIDIPETSNPRRSHHNNYKRERQTKTITEEKRTNDYGDLESLDSRNEQPKDDALEVEELGITTVVPIVDADSHSDTASPGIPILQAAEMAELLDSREAHRPDPMKLLRTEMDKRENAEIDDVTENVMKAAENASVEARCFNRIAALTTSPRSKICTRTSSRGRSNGRQSRTPDLYESDSSLAPIESPHKSSDLLSPRRTPDSPRTPERPSGQSTPVGSPTDCPEELGFSATRRGRYKKTVTLPPWYKSPEARKKDVHDYHQFPSSPRDSNEPDLNLRRLNDVDHQFHHDEEMNEDHENKCDEKVRVFSNVEDLLKTLPSASNNKVPVIQLQKSNSPKRKLDLEDQAHPFKIRRTDCLGEETAGDKEITAPGSNVLSDEECDEDVDVNPAEFIANPRPNPVLLSLIERMQRRVPMPSTNSIESVDDDSPEETSKESLNQSEDDLSDEELGNLLLDSSSSSAVSEELSSPAEVTEEEESQSPEQEETDFNTSEDKTGSTKDVELMNDEVQKTELNDMAGQSMSGNIDQEQRPTSSTDCCPLEDGKQSIPPDQTSNTEDFSRESMFVKMEKFYEELQAEVAALEEQKEKAKLKAITETRNRDSNFPQSSTTSSADVVPDCDPSPSKSKNDFGSFEKKTNDKKLAFVSQELDSFLNVSGPLKNHFLRSDERLNPTQKPEKFYQGSDVHVGSDSKPEIDVMDGLLFLSFGSEETLSAHAAIENDHDLVAKHVDVYQRLRYLHRPEADEKGDAYRRSVKKKVKRYEKILAKETKKVQMLSFTEIKPLQKTSDPTKVKGWKGKFGSVSTIGGVDVYKYKNGRIHWRTENRLLKTLSPTRVRTLGLALKKRRRKSPVLSHKKNKGQSPTIPEQIRTWKAKRKGQTKLVPKPGESASTRPRLWVKDDLSEDELPNFDEAYQILSYAVEDFKTPPAARKAKSTSRLKCEILSATKVREALKTLTVPSTSAEKYDVAVSEDESKCNKPGCRYGCVCHIFGPDETNECQQEYCRLGCVCQSINSSNKPRTSCYKPQCRFRCKCKEDDFKPDLTLPRLRDKSGRRPVASKWKDMISWDYLHGSGVQKNPRRRERDRSKKIVMYDKTKSYPDQPTFSIDPEYKPLPNTSVAKVPTVEPPRKRKREARAQTFEKKKRKRSKNKNKLASMDSYRAVSSKETNAAQSKEDDDDKTVKAGAPSTCARVHVYVAKHMRCRCPPDRVYTNCQSLKCVHAGKQHNVRSRVTKPANNYTTMSQQEIAHKLAETEQSIQEARTKFRRDHEQRRVGTGGVAEDERMSVRDGQMESSPVIVSEKLPTASASHSLAMKKLQRRFSELEKKQRVWTTQMMLLQPKRRQDEAASCKPQLLEIKSCCQWESIRLQILGFVAQQLKNCEYPPVCRVAIGQFIVEIIVRSDKPTKIPAHLQSALPLRMHAIRISIRPIMTASDVIGASRPDLGHLEKLAAEVAKKNEPIVKVKEEVEEDKTSVEDVSLLRIVSVGSPRVSTESGSSTPRAENIFEAFSCDSDDCRIIEKSPPKLDQIDLTEEASKSKLETLENEMTNYDEAELQMDFDTFMRESDPRVVNLMNFSNLPTLVRQALANQLWSLTASSDSCDDETRDILTLSKVKHPKFDFELSLRVLCSKKEFESEIAEKPVENNQVECEIVEMDHKSKHVPMECDLPVSEKIPSSITDPTDLTNSTDPTTKPKPATKDETESMPELIREDNSDPAPDPPSEHASATTPILANILTQPPEVSPPPMLHKETPYNSALETHTTKRSRRKEKLETRTIRDDDEEVLPMSAFTGKRGRPKLSKTVPDVVAVPMYQPKDRVHPKLSNTLMREHSWVKMEVPEEEDAEVDVDFVEESVNVKNEVVYLGEVKEESDTELEEIIDILAFSDEGDQFSATCLLSSSNGSTPRGTSPRAPDQSYAGSSMDYQSHAASSRDYLSEKTSLQDMKSSEDRDRRALRMHNLKERYRRKAMGLAMQHLRDQVYADADLTNLQKPSKVTTIDEAVRLIRKLQKLERELMKTKEESLKRLMGYISVKYSLENQPQPDQEELKRLAVTRLGRKFLEAPSSTLSFARYCSKYACQDHPIEKVLRNEQRLFERLNHAMQIRERQRDVANVVGKIAEAQIETKETATYTVSLLKNEEPEWKVAPQQEPYYAERSRQICSGSKLNDGSKKVSVLKSETKEPTSVQDVSHQTKCRRHSGERQVQKPSVEKTMGTFCRLEPSKDNLVNLGSIDSIDPTKTSDAPNPQTSRATSPRIVKVIKQDTFIVRKPPSTHPTTSQSGRSAGVFTMTSKPVVTSHYAADFVVGRVGALSTPTIMRMAGDGESERVRLTPSTANNGSKSSQPVVLSTGGPTPARLPAGARLLTTTAIKPGDSTTSASTTNLTFVMPNSSTVRPNMIRPPKLADSVGPGERGKSTTVRLQAPGALVVGQAPGTLVRKFLPTVRPGTTIIRAAGPPSIRLANQNNLNKLLLVPDGAKANSGFVFVPLAASEQVTSPIPAPSNNGNQSILLPVNLFKAKVQNVKSTSPSTEEAGPPRRAGSPRVGGPVGSVVADDGGVNFLNLDPCGPRIVSVSSRDTGDVNGAQ